MYHNEMSEIERKIWRGMNPSATAHTEPPENPKEEPETHDEEEKEDRKREGPLWDEGLPAMAKYSAEDLQEIIKYQSKSARAIWDSVMGKK